MEDLNKLGMRWLAGSRMSNVVFTRLQIEVDNGLTHRKLDD